MNKKKIVFGICGSFCNHRNVLNELYWLHQEYDITFVISENVSASSTRFFERSAFRAELEKLTGLTTLELSDVPLESAEPLEELPLERFFAYQAPAIDWQPVTDIDTLTSYDIEMLDGSSLDFTAE